MADSKAIREPSGDHSGFVSGPSCVTSFRIVPSATVTMEMSVEPEAAGVGFCLWSNAMLFPSGDHAKLPTVNAPEVSDFVDFDWTSMVQRCDIRWSWSTTSNSPYFLSRSFTAALLGSVAVYAIVLPSGDHAKPPTPSSAAVSAMASPADGLMT